MTDPRSEFMQRCADDVIRRLTAPVDPRPPKPVDPNKPYGWYVEVLHHNGEIKTYHFTGSQSKARNRAMLKSLAWKIISISPVTKEQWIRAYGDPSIRI